MLSGWVRQRTPFDPEESVPPSTAHHVERVTAGGVAVFSCGRRLRVARLVNRHTTDRCRVCERRAS